MKIFHRFDAFLFAAAVCAAACLALPGCGGAQHADVPPAAGEQAAAPLIDRELFFGDPLITASQISPDGRFIAFIKPYRGVRNLWVVATGEDFDSARPLSANERALDGYFWSCDGQHLLFVKDSGGDENYHVYAVAPEAEAEAETGVPAARDLTDIEGVRAIILDVPKNHPGALIVGLNDRDPSLHDVYRVDIATGERTLVYENRAGAFAIGFDSDGGLRLAMRQLPDGSQELLRVDGDTLTPIYHTKVEETATPLHVLGDGSRAYISTNRGDDVDLQRLMLLDLATGETELVEEDPEAEVDLGGAIFHPQTEELLATYYVGDYERIYAADDAVAADLAFLREELPRGTLAISSTTLDLSTWLVTVSSDVDPGSVYVYQRAARSVELLYRSRPDLPSEHLAEMQPVRYRARDGLAIPGYLTLPRGVEAKGLPVVIHPHGGPWARDVWGYDPYAQFLANRGYAVLQPNFRSSTGYGKAFLHAGDRSFGTGAMQHDISDGVQWLIDEGIADPERVCIFGGSYGGYATLAGVTFTPDLYTCGVPYVAPSNLITLIESFPAYWRPFMQGTWYARVGDPAIEADRADLLARSPLAFVDRIEVPLLVVHGANDPRVKQHESDQLVVALREKGHEVEYIVAPDEGHGFRGSENRLALAVALERFLGKHLGGRVQGEVNPTIAERLAAITVDVAAVEMPDLSGLEAAMTAPLPALHSERIRPARLVYAVAREMGEQTMRMEVVRSIAACKGKNARCWRVADQASSPMGALEEVLLLDRETLLPIERTSKSANHELSLRYSDSAVTGSMTVMGNRQDLSAELAAPVFGDSAGLALALAAMPLAADYRTQTREFDPMTQKVLAYALAVSGSESIEVPAGSFDTWRVEMRPIGRSSGKRTLHVTKDAPHHLVRALFEVPAEMGGGSLRIELQSNQR
ncbi:alpha/beta fold hydrolase [Haliangium ochraceum]|uniref:Peptidase S9 prolyl oligopeptidase active site domain protein n=1 Tax=Haliangium ochraceum (strain DSM 14365 / JCM 11303 / SMP-2) TaxID=502025 RepID=D0LSK4_HALO1|nr:alpha/beta fold hydrolase [Haliangium ochraceum]ACY15703.1 peptidase S9 prolyl oligopeptidase active site domain protein [Haliangium ochraceum DSM 14365]